jgi:hypothetical protein
MRCRLGLVALSLLACPVAVHAARSYDNCTGYIDSLPATISAQGTWCLRKDTSTSITSGAAITVATHNAVIDCNDFKIGGLPAGNTTMADGIYAVDKSNTTVRNCNIRGFRRGVALTSGDSLHQSAGHLVERNRINDNTFIGVYLDGDSSMVRDNMVFDTGGGPTSPYSTAIATVGAVDIFDNTISGVLGGYGSVDVPAYGITTYLNPGTLRGNRIRDVRRHGKNSVVGILISTIDVATGHVVSTTLRENDLIYDKLAGSPNSPDYPDSYGVYCGVPKQTPAGLAVPGGRVKDTTAQGFDTGISSYCGDAGGNDVSSL